MPCGKSKARYVSKDEAKRAKKNINKSFSKAKITNIYWCDPCAAYHLTSMPKEKSRNITRHNNNQP